MRKLITLLLVLSLLLTIAACGSEAPINDPPSPLQTPADIRTTPEPSPSPNNEQDILPVKSIGQIFLYGEFHGVEKIILRQLEIWHDYYNNENMRHIFIEAAYYIAESLNIWMKSDNDDMLDSIFIDLVGTYDVSYTRFFYKTIKTEYPETIFHGTDVGHGNLTPGRRFLRYLDENGLKDSEQYLLTQEAMEQGRRAWRNNRFDHEYREAMMAENFIREFDKLADKNAIGIFGLAHTEFGNLGFDQSVPTMAERLRERYGDAVYSESLAWMTLMTDPLRIDVMTVNGEEYEAAYFGEQDISMWFDDFILREFWRLENAYDDFKDNSKTGLIRAAYNDFLMLTEFEQVYVIDYTKTDGSLIRRYYRSDGIMLFGLPAIEEFEIN
jgi:predicted small lipoprotein YifL